MQKSKEEIAVQLRQEYEAGTKFRDGRSKDWQATEDLYYGRVKKTVKGRFNVPIPIMAGFVDTLLSKIDDPPVLKFEPSEEADYRSSKKVQALWDVKKTGDDDDYESKDLDVKKLAIFYGRGIFKTYADSAHGFNFSVNVVDPYNFYVDPMGGGSLEKARYLGEDCIWLSKSQLLEGANDGLYDKKAVVLIVNSLTPSAIKDNDTVYQNKQNRLASLGLVGRTYNFQGDGMERFVESGTIIDGERYYALWHYASGAVLRCEPLKEVFRSGLWWWTSWATHRDSFNFWSKSPSDDVRPIAEVIKVLANQELDNRQKRNFGMRAYDPDVFTNGAELEYRPDGLVAVKAGSSRIQAIGSGIYQFETPELTGTINLVNWLDNIVGQKSGVTAATQGQSEDAKVGIYLGNIQQVADRLSLYNKSYVKCHKAIGRRFLWGVYEHLNEKQAVRLVGENGVEWDDIRGRDINPDMDIHVESGSAEMQLNYAKKAKRTETILAIKADPNLAGSVNKKWLIEQLMLSGEFTDEEVRVALDAKNDGSREVLSRAAEAIQEMVSGKEPKLYRGATTAFQQKLIDFATDKTEDNLPLFLTVMAYAEAHNDIVMENMSRKAMLSGALGQDDGPLGGGGRGASGLSDILAMDAKASEVESGMPLPEKASSQPVS